MKLTTPAELARRIGVAESTMYRWLTHGTIAQPCVRIGGARGYTAEEADAIASAHFERQSVLESKRALTSPWRRVVRGRLGYFTHPVALADGQLAVSCRAEAHGAAIAADAQRIVAELRSLGVTVDALHVVAQ